MPQAQSGQYHTNVERRVYKVSQQLRHFTHNGNIHDLIHFPYHIHTKSANERASSSLIKFFFFLIFLGETSMYAFIARDLGGFFDPNLMLHDYHNSNIKNEILVRSPSREDEESKCSHLKKTLWRQK